MKLYLKFKLWFDRLLSKSMWLQLFVLLVFLGIIYLIALGIILAWYKRDFALQSNQHLNGNMWLLPFYLLVDSNALNNFYINNEISFGLLAIFTITFLLGAFVFNGAIISVITNSIGLRVERHRNGHIHYLRSGHYIILGYDDIVPSIIHSIFERNPKADILLMSARDVDYIREHLMRIFDQKQMSRIIINYGHRTSVDYHAGIHLESAKQVYIAGDRSHPAHDAVNVKCVDNICNYLEQPQIHAHPERIICVFEDIDTYAAFKTSEIFSRVRNLGMDFVPYNYYTGWAKQVFVRRSHKDLNHPYKPVDYRAVYGEGIKPEDPKYVHLVFIGTTNLAVAFAMEAANVLHFPNFGRDQQLRTRITFIDINADCGRKQFVTRNRHFFEVQSHYYTDLSDGSADKEKHRIPPSVFNADNGYSTSDSDFLDIQFEFVKGDVFSQDVQELIRHWACDTAHQYLSIFLALNDQRSNFVFGMNMPDEVYYNEIPVFMHQDRSDNFVTNLRNADVKIAENPKCNTYSTVADGQLHQRVQGGRYANIFPFGMNDTAYSADENSLAQAKLINYLYCTAYNEPFRFLTIAELEAIPTAEIERESNKLWRALGVADRWSNLYSAYSISVKLATLRAMRGLKLSDTTRDADRIEEREVKELARVEHNRWNVEKLLMGYRKPRPYEDKYVAANAPYADQLSRNKKRFIHHDLRPYDELDSIAALDVEFSRYIPWIVRTAKAIIDSKPLS